MRNSFRFLVPVLTLALVVRPGVTAVQAADGPDVPPIVVEGNASCTDLGCDNGYGSLQTPPGLHVPGTSSTVTISSDGTYFDWTSTLGMDAVIVKGGNNSNVYTYDPESYGDDGLSAPTDLNNGKPFGISHIEFCYDFEPTVTKNAQASYDADPHLGYHEVGGSGIAEWFRRRHP